MTAGTITVMGDMPLVCHKNTVTPLILDFFREAGLRPAIRTDTYETEEEAVAIARKHSEEGKKLVYVYPPPSALLDDGSFLVPVPLYTYLNDKSNIGRLVEREHQPGHCMLSVDSLDELFDFLPGGKSSSRPAAAAPTVRVKTFIIARMKLAARMRHSASACKKRR